jgi:endo-1,4-beta-xylanase
MGTRRLKWQLWSFGAIVAMVATLLVAGNAPSASAAATCHPFPDVTASNPHCENIAWIKTQGITKPADGLYHPLDSVSRGQMVAFLYRVERPGQASPKCASKPYKDVSTSNVFCGYITWAKNNGMTYGYPDGTFRANNTVNRGSMAAFLYRISNSAHPAAACTHKPYTDVAVNSTFCKVIAWAKANGITYGVGDGKYGPSLVVTRQAMASFLHRIVDYRNSQGGGTTNPPCTPTVYVPCP